jgi:acetolactate synthase-1/2/3 large subunit
MEGSQGEFQGESQEARQTLATQVTLGTENGVPAGKLVSAGNVMPPVAEGLVSGAEALMRALLLENVDTIFGYPGGAIMPVYDALYNYSDRIRHVLVRHEQGASHAAEGYARVTGKAGVCLATSGPGATNLVTGLADAMLDSVPMVAITGQVAKAFLGTDAFQETDIIGITMPVTKWNYQITSAAEIPEIISKAFYIAQNGRPGPVLIDITKNAQIEKCVYSVRPYQDDRQRFAPKAPAQDLVSQAAQLINSAQKPLLLVGRGVLISKAEKELLSFAEKSGIPVASTLLGLSAFPSDHPLYVGMLGMHGNYGPNVLTNQADLIIALGMRFDDRVTGDLKKYALQAQVIHIDVDAAELQKNVAAVVAMRADARLTLQALLPQLQQREHPAWLEEFRTCAEREFSKVICRDLFPTAGAIKMSEAIRVLCERSAGQAILVADVGQHQMAAARYYRFKQPDSFITSGGLGTMGFAVPAAMGAAQAQRTQGGSRPVLAVVGDGGFQMTLQELGTIAQEKLPVKIVILNNNYLGMVRQWQELFFQGRYSSVHLDNPDFIKLAEGFRISAERVDSREGLSAAVQRMLTAPEAYLLEVVVGREDNVFPMVPAGSGVADIRLE